MLLLGQLYVSFFLVGLFCVGGGYASVPLIEAQVIDEHAWLTLAEFLDIFAISQMTPGPIGINAATFVGTKIAGLPGAIAATSGFVSPSVLVMTFLAWLFQRFGKVAGVRGILNGLRPAVVALIAAAAVLFLCLALFGSETLPGDLREISWPNLAIIVAAWCAVRRGSCGVISVLVYSGLAGLALGSLAALI